MTLQRRLVLLLTGAVLAVLLVASLACYAAMRAYLRNQLDDGLRDQASIVRRLVDNNSELLRSPPQEPGRRAALAAGTTVLVLDRSGRVVVRRATARDLPVTQTQLAVAAGRDATTVFEDRESAGVALRAVTMPAREGAVVVAQSVEPLRRALSRLRLVLVLLVVVGTAAAAALGRLFARTVTRPVQALSDAAETISRTEELDRRIAVEADDELGDLTRRFNAMLERLQQSRAALEASVAAQQRLVADASHELRTPVASLHGDLQYLRDYGDLRDGDRELLDEVVRTSAELGELIADVVELARGDEPVTDQTEVRLDALVEEAVDRARRLHRGHGFATDLEPCTLVGRPKRLARAVNNLLDNAAEHAPEGSTVVVTLRDGHLEVADEGPGFDPDDLPRVFDRFYRGATRRGPGSGLGLAIVEQVAVTHGGRASARTRPEGGAVVAMALPVRVVAGRQPAGTG